MILLIRPITKVLVAEAYYSSWQYAPYLILAVSFSCLVTFLGTVYNAVKKNAMVTVTTALGAALNLVLNVLMIPKYGPVGAAAATFLSYFIVFLIRAVDTRKYIKIDMQPLRILLSLGLLLAQVLVSMKEPKGGVIWQVAIFLVLLLCNLGYVIFIARRVLEMIGGLRAKAGRKKER